MRQKPTGVTARVTFTNNLFPSGALPGMSGAGGSALTSGGSGRLWWSPADRRGRIELQSDAGDAQILWDSDDDLTVWDSSSNTVYTFLSPTMPERAADPARTGPTLATSTIPGEPGAAGGRLGGGPCLDRGRACVPGDDLARPLGRADRLGRARLGCRPRRAARDRGAG